MIINLRHSIVPSGVVAVLSMCQAGVTIDMPLQAYFRINAPSMGQFERTLIIAEPGSFVHYVEGCSAPFYRKNSLHSAVVELIALTDAHIRYTTIQNWSQQCLQLSD